MSITRSATSVNGPNLHYSMVKRFELRHVGMRRGFEVTDGLSAGMQNVRATSMPRDFADPLAAQLAL